MRIPINHVWLTCQPMIDSHPYWAGLILTAHLRLYQHWQEMIPIYTQRYQCCAPACCVCCPCDGLSSHENTSLSIRQGRPQAGFVLFLAIANKISLHTLVLVVFFFHFFSIYLEGRIQVQNKWQKKKKTWFYLILLYPIAKISHFYIAKTCNFNRDMSSWTCTVFTVCS